MADKQYLRITQMLVCRWWSLLEYVSLYNISLTAVCEHFFLYYDKQFLSPINADSNLNKAYQYRFLLTFKPLKRTFKKICYRGFFHHFKIIACTNNAQQLRAFSICVASPVTSPANSVTLIYVITLANRRRAFH